jgi:hypothetical protein
MKCPYCHQVIIPDLQAMKIVELPEVDVIVHKNPCGILIEREIDLGHLSTIIQKLSAA